MKYRKTPLSIKKRRVMLTCIISLAAAFLLWAFFETQKNWYDINSGQHDWLYWAVITIQWIIIAGLLVVSMLSGLGWFRISNQQRRARRARQMSRWGLRTTTISSPRPR